jgi:hypothetical protein
MQLKTTCTAPGPQNRTANVGRLVELDQGYRDGPAAPLTTNNTKNINNNNNNNNNNTSTNPQPETSPPRHQNKISFVSFAQAS